MVRMPASSATLTLSVMLRPAAEEVSLLSEASTVSLVGDSTSGSSSSCFLA